MGLLLRHCRQSILMHAVSVPFVEACAEAYREELGRRLDKWERQVFRLAWADGLVQETYRVFVGEAVAKRKRDGSGGMGEPTKGRDGGPAVRAEDAGQPFWQKGAWAAARRRRAIRLREGARFAAYYSNEAEAPGIQAKRLGTGRRGEEDEPAMLPIRDEYARLMEETRGAGDVPLHAVLPWPPAPTRKLWDPIRAIAATRTLGPG